MPLRAHGLSALSPVLSALLADTGAGIASISCQFIFISQRLAAASQNTPATLPESSRTVHGASQPCLSPSRAINGRGNRATAAGCRRKAPSTTQGPVGCHRGFALKPGHTTGVPHLRLGRGHPPSHRLLTPWWESTGQIHWR